MSLSPIPRHLSSQIKNIPTKRMLLPDGDLGVDLSTTPGGTIYSTTPGGTRIVYERSVLMSLRSSPMSQTPPKSGVIPDFLLKGGPAGPPSRATTSPPKCVQPHDDDQFVLEI